MKTENKTIEFQVKKEDEGKYLRLPLDIPDHVEILEIKPSYTGDEADSTLTDEEKNVIDFALTDENGDDLGASGSNTRPVKISRSFASAGYKRREPKGKWTIIIGCYQIKKEGSTVRYDITFRFKEYRYLKGDIHTHTLNSDGSMSYDDLARKAAKKGLDFLFITDHNNSTEDLKMPAVAGLTVIDGLELTNYKAHVNLLGVKKPYNGSYAVGSLAELNEKLEQARQNGAMRVVNHPFCHMCPVKWNIDDIAYDGIEIWNGPSNRKELKALDWWQKKLEAGERIPVVGGSDYHRDYYITDLLASPATRVRCDSNDKETILKALKEGRCVVTKTTDSPMIDIRCGGLTIGDTVEFSGRTEVEISVDKLKKNHALQVFNQTGMIYEETAVKKGRFAKVFPVEESGFIRAQILYKPGFIVRFVYKKVMGTLSKEEAKKPIPALLEAITNPIYFKKN